MTTDKDPCLRLKYGQAWESFFTLPDYADLRVGFDRLITATSDVVMAPWANDWKRVQRHWQVILEEISIMAISSEDRAEMTELELIETAWYTLVAGIEGSGWVVEFVSFLTPALAGSDEEGDAIALKEVMNVEFPTSIVAT